MGRGRSPVGGSGKKATAPVQTTPATPKANTPSGVDKDGFMKMSSAEKLTFINNVVKDPNIKVPVEVDDSITSKVMYAMGVKGAMDVVDDATFDQMKAGGNFQFNNDIFRTIYNTPSGITGLDIAKSNLKEEYTQMSGSGGSVHGRALYFAGGQTGLYNSMIYRSSNGGNVTIRANVKKNARIVNESTIDNSAEFKMYRNSGYSTADSMALAALSLGADGWRQNYGNHNYTMIINRTALVGSSTVKNTPARFNSGTLWSDIGKTSRTKKVI